MIDNGAGNRNGIESGSRGIDVAAANVIARRPPQRFCLFEIDVALGLRRGF
jgi:hypothetical protein